MKVAGIVAEYNPFHSGHLWHIEKTRQVLAGDGEDTAVVCVMSGNFVQRGDFAIFNKHSRAAAALAGTGEAADKGADLIIELPLPYALSSAEGFAQGAVFLLGALGVVTHLSFGCETSEASELAETVGLLLSDRFPKYLKDELKTGVSFASARQRALETMTGADASVLEEPNNILGIEYIKAIKKLGLNIEPVAVPRFGPGHDLGEPAQGIASASHIRRLLYGGAAEAWDFVPLRSWEIFFRETVNGRGPVSPKNSERAILDRLRRMSAGEYESIPDATEGLHLRIMDSARRASSLGQVIDEVKTKRYARARIRRMVMAAYLGLKKEHGEGPPPYIRVLAFNEKGRALLRQISKQSALPVITKPAQAKTLPEKARSIFELEAMATDLYVLAYPDLRHSAGGQEWMTGPVMEGVE